MPTTVNPQITDAVTQGNTKVVAESPALALGTLYQSAAHSTGILYENAVAAQQQLAKAAQAATIQGVIQIYSVDTMAGASATDKVASLDDSVRASQAKLAETLPPPSLNTAVERAVHETLHDVIGSAGEFGYALRNTTDAHAASLRRINEVQYAALFDVIRLAATSACFAAMLRAPDKTDEFQRILALLDDLAQRR
jgi:hypothetical protein